MDTRTRRTPTGERSSGFDDTPALSMVKVPSDPAQVIVNHASFRVRLGASTRRAPSPHAARQLSAPQDAGAVGRRRPVVWSGKSAPDDSGAHRLLQAVRSQTIGHGEDPGGDGGATQLMSRLDVRGLPGHGYDSGATRLLPHMRNAGSTYDEPVHTQPLYGGPAYDDSPYTDSPYADPSYDEPAYGDPSYDAPGHGLPGHGEPPYGESPYGGPLFRDEVPVAEPGPRGRRRGGTPATSAAAAGVRHAYYPGRRMNLGVVLLPLRIFLGSISAYAGMGKLCDPVYFDGGKRGSMVTWLNTLHPWQVAEPMRQFALEHPVGTGLVIAFLQVIAGVLTVLGLWQRVAAAVGALLSAALIVTVSWRTAPAYDAPDIIYLAAWSPLVIAGAPVYSVDARLAGGAWRRLGPRADIWELRRYVLRRGALLAALVTGVTLLVGSLLGGAVRDADRVVVPGPGEAPRNELPGSPLPGTPGGRQHPSSPSASRPSATRGTTSSSPSSEVTTPGTAGATGTATGGQPSQTQGTAGQAPPQHSAPSRQAPSTSAGPSSSGGSGTGGPTGGASGSSGGGGGSSSGGSDHLVGGLLG
ncbi:DoxX family membrane protein [Streptomyces sp. NPDC008222]|uniref:DoxX family protein n=1 Tax=Streptomyces sp. NPDC008222 TaxID=3364820 RepID=UPI0036E888F5